MLKTIQNLFLDYCEFKIEILNKRITKNIYTGS